MTSCSVRPYCISRLDALCLLYPVFVRAASRLAANGVRGKNLLFYSCVWGIDTTVKFNVVSNYEHTRYVIVFVFPCNETGSTQSSGVLTVKVCEVCPRVFDVSVCPSVPHVRISRICKKIVTKWNTDRGVLAFVEAFKVLLTFNNDRRFTRMSKVVCLSVPERYEFKRLSEGKKYIGTKLI